MAFIDAINTGFGRLQSGLFPTDPSLGLDPNLQRAAQGQALFQLGLGLLSGQNAAQAFSGASQNFQGAMDNAYKHTLIKRQQDQQQQDREHALKVQAQQDRQNAATTASRVSAALTNPQYSTNPGAYWDLVKSNPDVQAALTQAGIQMPQGAPPDYAALAQQLGAFGQASAAPTAPRDLNLKPVIDPKTGKPVLVPEAQAVGMQPYEKPPEQQLSRFTRPVGEGKVQDFVLDTHTGVERPLGAPYVASKGAFGDQAQALLASLAAKGVSLPVGLRSKDQMTATLNGLIEKFPSLQPDEIADRIAGGQIDFGAAKKETQTAAAQAGRVSIATNELNTFAPLVLKASAAVPRTSFVPINKLMQMGEAQISDPNLRQLKIGITSMLNAYDQLAGRGGTDVGKREEAHKLLTSADSPEALSAAISMFQKEAQAAGQAAAQAMRYRKPGESEAPAAPVEAVNALIADPSLSEQFKAKYGYLPAGY